MTRKASSRPAGLLPLLAAAALLLAPFPARADNECGTFQFISSGVTCSAATYASGIRYNGGGGQNNAYSVTVPGSASTTTITSAGTQSVGVFFARQGNITLTIGGSTSGVAHVVNIVQGTSTNNANNRNNGVYIRATTQFHSTTLDVRAGVTIGSASAAMRNHGIWMLLNPSSSAGRAAYAATLTNAAPIYARRAGIRFERLNGGPQTNPTVITNSGDIYAGVGNAGETLNPSSPHNLPHGISMLYGGTTHTGAMTFTNSGAISVTGAYTGIFLNYWGGGAFTGTNSGDIAAALGTGVNLDLNGANVDNIAFTNSGDVTALTLGIRVARDGGSTGTTSFINSGDVTVTGDAAEGEGHAVLLVNAGVSGTFTIENNGGVLRSKNHALTATMSSSMNTDDLTLTNTGSAISEEGHGIRVVRGGTGVLTVTNGAAGMTVSGGLYGIWAVNGGTGTTGATTVTHSAGSVSGAGGGGIYASNAADNTSAVTVRVTGGSVSGSGRHAAGAPAHAVSVRQMGEGDAVFELSSGASLASRRGAGVFVTLGADTDNDAGQIDVDVAGSVTGRTGVLAEVIRASASGETRTSGDQPLIDVTWTGTFGAGSGTAANDDGRFAAATAAEALAFDQEASAGKAVEGTLHYGGAAGIEAYALSWRAVVAQVAQGDDPGAIADATAQAALLATSGPGSRRTAILAQFRAVLENSEIEVAAEVLTAIDSTATSVSDLSDAEIVTYLSTDSAAMRTLLRNILAQGLSEYEQAVLRAVATNTGLTAALDDTGAGFSASYKTAVNGLLNSYNIGNIRVAVDSGSITSRGDGIRAYYATPNTANGLIEVTVGMGVTIAAGGTGIQVANAGAGALGVTVGAGGTITAGRNGIHVVAHTWTAALTVENGSAITVSGEAAAGVGHAIWLPNPAASGAFTVTNSGALRSKNHALYATMSNTANTAAFVVTNTGAITSEDGDAIRVERSATGTLTVTSGAGASGGLYGIWAVNGGTGTTGATTVTHSAGAVSGAGGGGIYASNAADNTNAVTVRVTGGSVAGSGRHAAGEPAHAVTVRQMGTGNAIFELASGAGLASRRGAGVFATLGADADNNAGQIDVDVAGSVTGRTGVRAEVIRASASGETRAAGVQPLIDVTWTGTFGAGSGTAANDDGRFAAATAAQVLSFDQEASAGKAVEGTLHYGGAAGIEAYALSWRAVVAQVATGDDPGAIADATAQAALLSETDPNSRRTAILAQFRAALENSEIEVAASVLTAIDSTATSVADLSDAEIVTYLSTDDDATRALLRNILAQGLSEYEKAVLRAAATNTGLTAALDDTGAGFSTGYKTAVNALLARNNIGNIRVAVNSGSITSRGDGIRAYYATPNTANGLIEVTVGAGVTIAAGGTGIQVANAGAGALGVTVGTGGTITAGRNGIHVVAHTWTAALTVENGAAITVTGEAAAGVGHAIWLPNPAASGAFTVTNSGALRSKNHALYATMSNTANTAAFVVTNTGAITSEDGDAIRVERSATGTLTVTSGAGASGGLYGIWAVNGGTGTTGATTVTHSAGTVSGAGRGGIYASNAADNTDDVTVRVTGGSVSASGRHAMGEPAHAVTVRQMGTGEAIFSLNSGTSLSSTRGAGVFATLGADTDNSAGQIDIDIGGSVTGRTGVLAEVIRASASGETRMAADQPLIDVAWVGTFTASGTGDAGRFAATSAEAVVAFDQEASAGQAVEGTLHYGGPAGIEAYALSWREVVDQVAAGDDPGAIADAAAQTALLATTGPASRRTAILAQFRAALGNGEVEVARSVLSAIDSTATSVSHLSDAEIVTYLSTDDAATRALLRSILARGLSDKEKAVLRAVAAGEDLDPPLDDTAAGFSMSYKTAVKALLDRNNVGNINVGIDGSISHSRGDGIRAYYATPNDANGSITVTVADGARVSAGKAGVYAANAGSGSGTGGIRVIVGAGATVTGGTAGIHVAGAGAGNLMLARKYTTGYVRNDPMDPAPDGEALVQAEYVSEVGGVPTTTPLPNQLVTIYGTVTGGTDAAVHLSGGGVLLLFEGGKVIAGSSGRAILVNDPGPAIVYIDGEVRGGAGAPAAVHLTGGGTVTVGVNGRIAANGAEYAIRGGGTEATGVDVILATNGPLTDFAAFFTDLTAYQYREDALEAFAERLRVEGPLADIDSITFREDLNGVPTGYTFGEITFAEDGLPDTGDLEPRPAPEPKVEFLGCAAALDGRCRLYEALPSLLAAANELPTYAERTSAARGANGAWARVEVAQGKWRAKKATTAGKLAYDHQGAVARAGVDFLADDHDLVGGVSVHVLEGKAKLAGAGEIDLNGWGGGLSATWRVGEFYVDAQAAATRYDVGLESNTHGKLLKKDAGGTGYALGLDAGRRMSVGGMSVTPSAGVAWSKVGLDDFNDLETAGGEGARARVSMEDAGGVKGRLGVMVETELGGGGPSRVFGSLDVEREFSEETEVKVGEETLKTEARSAAVRLGAGGVFDVGGNAVLRAMAGYRTSGSGTSGYAGSLELQMRF